MSKKLWCRRCKEFEMHDSSSQKEINRLRSGLSKIIAECSQEGCDGEPWNTFQGIARKALDGHATETLQTVLRDALANDSGDQESQ